MHFWSNSNRSPNLKDTKYRHSDSYKICNLKLEVACRCHLSAIGERSHVKEGLVLTRHVQSLLNLPGH